MASFGENIFKLTYFPLGARAFATRVCLRAAGVKFEDQRITFAEWGELKKTGFAPLGQLPVLEVGEKKFCESIPLSVFAAKIAGLYPTDPLEQLQIDEVIAIVDELWNKIAKTDGKVPETRVAYGKEVAPSFLVTLASKLRGPFFHGEKPGVADLWVYQYCSFFASGFFDHIPTDFVSAASPELAAHTAAVKASDLYVKFGTPE